MKKKILVFLHGTAIMHRSGVGKTREERVKQSENREPSILDYENYLPIGNAVEKLKGWQNQGNTILYLSSHDTSDALEKDKKVLETYGFPEGEIFYRRNGESYADVTEKIMPDILIEDDCESIGGRKEMTIASIKSELKKKIKSIVVKEFAGIDNLPDEIT